MNIVRSFVSTYVKSQLIINKGVWDHHILKQDCFSIVTAILLYKKYASQGLILVFNNVEERNFAFSVAIKHCSICYSNIPITSYNVCYTH